MSAFPPRPAVHLHLPAFILPPSAFFLIAVGCLGITGQLILLRELMAAYGGNELSAGVTLAAWLLCEALGAWLAGHARWPRLPLSDSAPSIVHRSSSVVHRSSLITHRSSLLTALSVFFSLAAVPAAVLVRPALGILPGEILSIPHLLMATFAVVLLPAASHGALFVRTAALRTQGIGSAYVLEGIGTAFAGLACFILLNRLPSLAVVALSALPLIMAAGFGHGRTRTQWTMWTLGLGVLTSLVFALPLERMAWGAAWRGQRVTAVANSPYGKVVQMERANQQLVLYDGLPVVTVPTTQTERIEELALLPALLHPMPRRVLVLGHDLAIPAALARFRPDIEVSTVQLDPVLARMSVTALSCDSSLLPPRFSLIISDPLVFLRTNHSTFDGILLTDAAPTNLGSSRLFSLEFYRLCRSRLAPGGILATAGPGDPTGLSPDVAGILSTRLRTLKTAFEYVLPLAADFPLLLASEQRLVVPAESVPARLSRLSQPPELLDSAYAVGLLDPFRQEALASVLQTDVRGPRSSFIVSSAAFPRELFLNMVRENRLASPAFGAAYARLGGFSPRLLLLLGAVLLVTGLIGARVRGRPFGRGFAILTSGFSGAAVSSLLIFAWQVRFGSVFSGIALLLAAFMLGTVLGGILGCRRSLVPHPSSLAHLFAVSDLVLAACAGAAALLIHGGPAAEFLAVNCLTGASLGFQFAVAGSIVHRPSSVVSAPESVSRRAGVLTALDLVGGGLGGILTALLVVPVFGIGAGALVAGVVKLTSALTQLMPGRPVPQP
jgi:spermidine synthase